jgi:rhodanese-related sulfurtransferase
MKIFTTSIILALTLVAPLSFAADEKAATKQSAVSEYKSKAPKLGRAEFDKLLATPDKIVIIDLRRPDELTKNGGFPVFLSIQSNDLEKYLNFIPRDRTVITVSNHAGRAGRGADLLVSKGFKVAGAVGAQDYEAEGGTLSKIVPPAPKVAAAAE